MLMKIRLILNSSRENPVSSQTWLTDRKTYGYFEYFSNKNGQKHYHIYNISVNLSVTEAELPIVLKSFFIKKFEPLNSFKTYLNE